MDITGNFLTVPLMFGGFVAIWMGSIWLTSRISGWTRLTELYPPPVISPGNCAPMQSAIIRQIRYRGSIRVCANHEGVQFENSFIFRFGHPPFFVPWAEITAKKRSYSYYTVVELRFERAKSIPVKLRLPVADRLVLLSGERWHYQDD